MGKNFDESVLMMDKDKFDFYYWLMDLSHSCLVIENHNFEISRVTSVNTFHVGQILRKPNKLNKSDFSSFLIENVRLLIIILIGYIVILMAIFTLLKLIRRRCSFYNLLTINRTRLGSISFKIDFIILAFSFFLFFNLSILTNMIKTEKVTVSTSEFIDSISKLNKTTKPLATVDTNSTNLFYRLLKKSKQSDALTVNNYANFDHFISKISKNRFDSYFYFMDEIYFFVSVYYVTLLNRSVDHFVFFKPTIYYESFRAMFYRKNLDQKMKQILNHR